MIAKGQMYVCRKMGTASMSESEISSSGQKTYTDCEGSQRRSESCLPVAPFCATEWGRYLSTATDGIVESVKKYIWRDPFPFHFRLWFSTPNLSVPAKLIFRHYPNPLLIFIFSRRGTRCISTSTSSARTIISIPELACQSVVPIQVQVQPLLGSVLVMIRTTTSLTQHLFPLDVIRDMLPLY